MKFVLNIFLIAICPKDPYISWRIGVTKLNIRPMAQSFEGDKHVIHQWNIY